ncbi:MAG: hypothetical protein GXO73_05290 [Calditrichaeota bacterium]|nr:hypothetical protein [Calditrichota bacterium]
MLRFARHTAALTFSVALALATTSGSLHAQGNTQLLEFHGGHYRFTGRVGVALTGLFDPLFGSPSLLTAGRTSPSNVCTNPGALAWNRRLQGVLGFRPGFGLNLDKFLDMKTLIRPEVDDAIADIRAPGMTLTDEDYPDVQASVGPVSLLSGVVTVPVGPVVLGFSLTSPFSARLSAVGSGMEMRLKTVDEEDPTREVTFFGSNDFALEMDWRMLSYAVAVSYNALPSLGLGLSVEGLSGAVDFTGRLDTQGIMAVAGIERAFNDPNDPWTNSLFADASASYSGQTARLHLGGQYRLSDRTAFGLSIQTAATLKMTGSASVTQYALPGFNLNAGADEDMLDPTAISLDEPTRTRLVDNPTGRSVDMHLPARTQISFATGTENVGLAVTVAVQSGSFQISHVLQGKDTESRYAFEFSRGLEFGVDLRLWGFFVGVGYGGATLRQVTPDGVEVQSFPFPRVTLGYTQKISSHLVFGSRLLALPDPVGGVGIGFVL